MKKTWKSTKGAVAILACCLVCLLITGASAYQQQGTHARTPQTLQGLYYYRGHLVPEQQHDQGWLNTTPPLQHEFTNCGIAIFFDVNQPGDFVRQQILENLYYHVWFQNMTGAPPSWNFTVGYNTSSGHAANPDSIKMFIRDRICAVQDHFLLQGMQVTSPEYNTFEDGANFTSVFEGYFPWLVSSPGMNSFLIFNVPCNEQLNQTGLSGDDADTDDDGLSDYRELYELFTNPYDVDTDHDGYSDLQEYLIGTNPNDYTDPGFLGFYTCGVRYH